MHLSSQIKMALHANIYTPCGSERITSFSGYKFPPLLRSRGVCNSIKAVAEKRDNLDHLQRVAQQLQPQPKKRAAQVSSPGICGGFPTARTVQQMMETMENMMEDPFTHNSTWPWIPERGRNGYDGYGKGRAPWAIKEGKNHYKIRFDVPGMTKNDVKVWVEERSMLVVKAEKVPRKAGSQMNGEEKIDEEEEWPINSYGRYSSRIALPENIEFEKIKAEVKDGVLYITIPKASTSSKVIDINVQ